MAVAETLSKVPHRRQPGRPPLHPLGCDSYFGSRLQDLLNVNHSRRPELCCVGHVLLGTKHSALCVAPELVCVRLHIRGDEPVPQWHSRRLLHLTRAPSHPMLRIVTAPTCARGNTEDYVQAKQCASCHPHVICRCRKSCGPGYQTRGSQVKVGRRVSQREVDHSLLQEGV